jgi:hypothetical protein
MMRSLLKEGLKYKKSNIMSETKGILINGLQPYTSKREFKVFLEKNNATEDRMKTKTQS